MTLYTFRRGGATLVTHDIIQQEYTSNYRTIAVSINGATEVRLMSRYRHSTAPSTIQGPPARHADASSPTSQELSFWERKKFFYIVNESTHYEGVPSCA